MKKKIFYPAIVLLLAILACEATSATPLPTIAFATPDWTQTAQALNQQNQPTETPVPTQENETPAPQASSAPQNTQSPQATADPGDAVRAGYFSSAPVIDGQLNEAGWQTTPIHISQVVYGAVASEADLSAEVHLGWDEDFLYLAAVVHDDYYRQQESGEFIYLGDSLEILLDADLAGDRGIDSLNADDYQLGISLGTSPADESFEAFLWFPAGLAGSRSSVLAASSLQGDGYLLEAAIPWGIFNLVPAAGDLFGFSVSLSDNDSPSENLQQGMISSAAGRRLTDPRTWGKLWLEAP